MLSHKTYQNQGICYITIAYCYVTKIFVARHKFPHVKVARNTKKVGQPCCNGLLKWRSSIFYYTSFMACEINNKFRHTENQQCKI